MVQVSRVQIVLGPQGTHMLRFQLSLCLRLLASASASLGAGRAWQPLWMAPLSLPQSSIALDSCLLVPLGAQPGPVLRGLVLEVS